MSDGIVYLTADFGPADGVQTSATVERGLSPTGPWILIGNVTLVGERGVFYDTAAPLDTQVWYRWTAVDPAVIVQGPFFEAGNSTVMLKDSLRPWANIELSFCATPEQGFTELCNPYGEDLVWVGFGDFVRRADANLFDIYNDQVPADIYGRRKRLDGSLRILSKTLAAADRVEDIFSGGGPLQLQMPAIYGWKDAFLQPGDLTEAYLYPDQRRPFRIWSAPFTLVREPLLTGAQGTECANWCAIETLYPTFAALTATGDTWAQVASGETVCGATCASDGYGECGYGEGPYGD